MSMFGWKALLLAEQVSIIVLRHLFRVLERERERERERKREREKERERELLPLYSLFAIRMHLK